MSSLQVLLFYFPVFKGLRKIIGLLLIGSPLIKIIKINLIYAKAGEGCAHSWSFSSHPPAFRIRFI